VDVLPEGVQAKPPKVLQDQVDPSAITERPNEALAALWGLRAFEGSPIASTYRLAIGDDLAAWAVPSTVAP